MIQGSKTRAPPRQAGGVATGCGEMPPCRAPPLTPAHSRVRIRAHRGMHPHDRNVKRRVDINARYATTRVPDPGIIHALCKIRAIQHSMAAAPHEHPLNRGTAQRPGGSRRSAAPPPIFQRRAAHTTVAGERQGWNRQLQSMGKFDAVARCERLCGLRTGVRIVLTEAPESTTQKGMCMKCASVMKVAAVAVVAGLAGCADTKPLEADVADLKQQVAKLQSDVASARSSAEQANSAAQAANAAASSAQGTATQALQAAQDAQKRADDVNEKLDRMFKRSISK
jgi:murein lipoprotein